MEHITKLRFKLCMFGILIMEYTKILCNHAGLDKNYSILSSTLNKNHISIAYHLVRCYKAEWVIKVACIETNSNLEDAMTEILTE